MMDQRSKSQLGRFRRISPVVCGFFKSGRTCRAGARCPLAHKIPRNARPATGLSDPNPDPGTVELLFKAAYMGPLDPPRDQSIRTLYIRLLNSNVHEEHLRDRFSLHGEIESIVYFGMRGVRCAFLTYTTRQAAEKAMVEHSSWIEVNGQNLKLLWGAHQIPKNAEQVGEQHDGDGFAWGKQNKDGGEAPIWSKRGYVSSELTAGCGFDGRRGCGNWDVGGGSSNWGKAKASGGFGECFSWGRASDDVSSWGKENYSGGGSNWDNQVDGSSWGQLDGGGFAWGSQNKYGDGGPSWSSLGDGGSKLSDGRGFGGGVNWGSWDFNSKNETNAGGGWETNTGDDDDVRSSGEADNAWGYKPIAGASSSSGSWGTEDQW